MSNLEGYEKIYSLPDGMEYNIQYGLKIYGGDRKKTSILINPINLEENTYVDLITSVEHKINKELYDGLPDGLSYTMEGGLRIDTPDSDISLTINPTNLDSSVQLFGSDHKINSTIYNDTILPNGLSYSDSSGLQIDSLGKALTINPSQLTESSISLFSGNKINSTLYNAGLPEGLSYENGIFNIAGANNSCGLHVDGLLSINNIEDSSSTITENATSQHLLLLGDNKAYYVKKVSVIHITGQWRSTDGYLQFNKLSDNVSYDLIGVRLTGEDRKSLTEYPLFNEDTVLRVVDGNDIVQPKDCYLTGIRRSAFDGCTNLTLTSLPKTITSIGNYAFRNCKNIQFNTIPPSVISIGDSAFANSGVRITRIPETVLDWDPDIFAGCVNIPSLQIDTVTSSNSIRSGSFTGCEGLRKVVITEERVLSLPGSNIFKGCIRLTQVILPPNLHTIGESTFEDCVSLSQIELPESVNTIGNRAFKNCSNLYFLHIPDIVTNIGVEAFENSGISIVVAPSHLHTIGQNVFRSCTSLRTADLSSCVLIGLGENPPTLPEGCFDGCTNLKKVVLSDSINVIEINAFRGCGTSLEEEEICLIDATCFTEQITLQITTENDTTYTPFTDSNCKLLVWRDFARVMGWLQIVVINEKEEEIVDPNVETTYGITIELLEEETDGDDEDGGDDGDDDGGDEDDGE